jgi:hypothetical protein
LAKNSKLGLLWSRKNANCWQRLLNSSKYVDCNSFRVHTLTKRFVTGS